MRTAGGDRGSLNNDTSTQILLTCESQRDVCVPVQMKAFTQSFVEELQHCSTNGENQTVF